MLMNGSIADYEKLRQYFQLNSKGAGAVEVSVSNVKNDICAAYGGNPLFVASLQYGHLRWRRTCLLAKNPI